MKKILKFMVLAMVTLIPIKVYASDDFKYMHESTYDEVTGRQTVKLFINIPKGATLSSKSFNINVNNGIITTVNSTELFKIDDITDGSNEKIINSASTNFTTTYKNNLDGFYTGNGSNVEVAAFTFECADKENIENCSATYMPEGGISQTIEAVKTSDDAKKQTTNVDAKKIKTGSFVSYVGIGAGLVLIAGAYVISKKSTKLYRI